MNTVFAIPRIIVCTLSKKLKTNLFSCVGGGRGGGRWRLRILRGGTTATKGRRSFATTKAAVGQKRKKSIFPYFYAKKVLNIDAAVSLRLSHYFLSIFMQISRVKFDRRQAKKDLCRLFPFFLPNFIITFPHTYSV